VLEARGRPTLSIQPLLITDAAPSFHEQQAHRRRTYSILMVAHIAGFALSYPLYLWQPWAGVVAIAHTGVLPWVAVLLANDPTPPRRAKVGELATLSSPIFDHYGMAEFSRQADRIGVCSSGSSLPARLDEQVAARRQP